MLWQGSCWRASGLCQWHPRLRGMLLAALVVRYFIDSGHGRSSNKS